MTKIVTRHYANVEGRSAAKQGYAGPNPYHGMPGRAAFHWNEGYCAIMRSRLVEGKTALPTVKELGEVCDAV